jgi:glyoxylase-like metal-dependent hydrolase (beta-lactamase superfamily II)
MRGARTPRGEGSVAKRLVRWIVRGTGALVALALLALALGLAWAHLAIRRERAPLPPVDEVMASRDASEKAPVRLSWINTASQPMPRSGVLDPGRDPAPGTPYVMSHPSFVLEWKDGKILLVDAGMSVEQAEDFGAPLERLGFAGPMQPIASVQAALGQARTRVWGIVFTHLHQDHVGGIADLCRTARRDLDILMTRAQDVATNYTTRSGRRLVADTPCAKVARIDGPPLLAASGFPGVHVVRAGGHTPGSQIVIAHVGARGERRTYVLTGDIVNALDGAVHDVPKPWAYRTFVVPEDETRQGELRRWLEQLRGLGATLLVSHDQRAIEAAALPAFARE